MLNSGVRTFVRRHGKSAWIEMEYVLNSTRGAVFTALLLAFTFPYPVSAQSQLTMPATASTRFLAAHGRRAWAAGYSNAGLEIWTGALQIASDVRPEFRRAGDVSLIPG